MKKKSQLGVNGGIFGLLQEWMQVVTLVIPGNMFDLLQAPRFDEFTGEALHMKTPRRIELRQPPIGDTTTPIATDGT